MNYEMRKIEEGTKDYRKLTLAAAMMEYESRGLITYTVEACPDIYDDSVYGDIDPHWHTTIVAYDQRECESWEALTPKEWAAILAAIDLPDIAATVDEIMMDMEGRGLI